MAFKKADEMEMAINFKAMRLAYVWVLLALVVWIGVEYATTKELPTTQFLIISIQNVVFFGSKVFMTRKMAGSPNEK